MMRAADALDGRPQATDQNRPAGQVLHLRGVEHPNFRFEWHPAKRKVYMIRLGVKPVIGQCIADEIGFEGSAYNAVLIFLRGYREHEAETAIPSRVTAEQRERAASELQPEGDVHVVTH
jgi:hypothetical protein